MRDGAGRQILSGSGWCALLAGLLLASSATIALGNGQDDDPDTLYYNADVLTMDAAPSRVEAILVHRGRIAAVGDAGSLRAAAKDSEIREVDLDGLTVLPGFIDGHSHFGQAMTLIDWADLSAPPTGHVDSIPTLLEALRTHVRRRGIAKGQWIIGYGYDDEALQERRHPTRDDIDAVFPDNPVLLMHISSHGMVLNSAALALAGIDASTPSPEGGVIGRRPGSKAPNGLLMDTAMIPAYAVFPRPNATQQMEAIDRAQQLYASNGYTTIQDGASSAELLALLDQAAAQGKLWLDVMALPAVMTAEELDPLLEAPFGSYHGHLKRGGIKVIADGSPQGRTAWFSKPMLVPGPNGQANWTGMAFTAEPTYDAILARVLAAGVPLWTHANGDAAIDMVIRAHQRAGVTANDDRRHVVVHSQFVRPDQLDAYHRLGLAASFFTNHAFFWGDVHLRNLGPERANRLSPLRSAHEHGIRYSNHSDYSVTPLAPMLQVWTAVNRTTRSGVVLGPEERVLVQRALEAMTIDAAWIYREENDKGSVTAGKRADFVILDRNPLAVAAEQLRDVRVVATIKDGRLVWGALTR